MNAAERAGKHPMESRDRESLLIRIPCKAGGGLVRQRRPSRSRPETGFAQRPGEDVRREIKEERAIEWCCVRPTPFRRRRRFGKKRLDQACLDLMGLSGFSLNAEDLASASACSAVVSE